MAIIHKQKKKATRQNISFPRQREHQHKAIRKESICGTIHYYPAKHIPKFSLKLEVTVERMKFDTNLLMSLKNLKNKSKSNSSNDSNNNNGNRNRKNLVRSSSVHGRERYVEMSCYAKQTENFGHNLLSKENDTKEKIKSFDDLAIFQRKTAKSQKLIKLSLEQVKQLWFKAVKEGNLKNMSQMLSQNIDFIYLKDKAGYTALHYAIECNNDEILSVLIASIKSAAVRMSNQLTQDEKTGRCRQAGSNHGQPESIQNKTTKQPGVKQLANQQQLLQQQFQQQQLQQQQLQQQQLQQQQLLQQQLLQQKLLQQQHLRLQQPPNNPMISVSCQAQLPQDQPQLSPPLPPPPHVSRETTSKAVTCPIICHKCHLMKTKSSKKLLCRSSFESNEQKEENSAAVPDHHQQTHQHCEPNFQKVVNTGETRRMHKCCKRLNRDILHVDVHRCPQLTTDDHRCPQQTTNDHRCPQQTTDDHRCPQQTTDDHRCFQLTTDDHRCLQLTTNDHRCLQLTNETYHHNFYGSNCTQSNAHSSNITVTRNDAYEVSSLRENLPILTNEHQQHNDVSQSKICCHRFISTETLQHPSSPSTTASHTSSLPSVTTFIY
ncbi:hypothetical protein HELRODRAFT_164345 [Helobdella robusta]|uniref:Uncharacterized protein n=1 Tax=Helobdella robusta TaxID=6412 RepID=T1EVA7_HELRO|nr:hypothetical protein HELRODRAFT_164345 [Helobdella robusta]ESN94489.1 hypothetical protein HELRODRAFT_164345 [Helobdella robusta]